MPNKKAILLTLPRSGSSWISDQLAEANGLFSTKELFNPNHPSARKIPELPLVFGTESTTCRPSKYIYNRKERLARLVEGLPDFNKEVWSWFRVPDLLPYAHLFIMHRPVQMTLPFSGNDPYNWYRGAWNSFLANQSLYRPAYAAVLERLRKIIETDHHMASVVHFLANQVLLRYAELYAIPVISYESVMFLSQEELIPLLAQWLPPTMRAEPSAAKICETRKFSPRKAEVSFFIHDHVGLMLEEAGIYVARAPQRGEVLQPRPIVTPPAT